MRTRQIMIAMGLLLVGTLCVQSPASAFDAHEFNKKVEKSFTEFDQMVSNSDDLINNAAGLLMCPKVGKIGLGVAVEGGACALQVDGETVAYYRASSASFGLTAGVASHSQVMAFMTEDSLQSFRDKKKTWEAGVDGQATVAKFGVGDKVAFAGKPIVVVAYGQKGLIGDLSVAGSRYKFIGSAEEYSKYGVPLHRFIATADVSDPSRRGSSTVNLTIDIQEWITDEERAAMTSVIREDGGVGAHEAMEEMPIVATVRMGNKVTVLQWARAVEMDNGNWRVILASSDPVEFALAAQQAAKVEGNFSIIQLDIDKNQVGTGVLQMGAQINYDNQHGVTIHQPGSQVKPVKLTSVSYRKMD